ncbi:NAD-dependent epimerase/dehydratase family protein [Legionella donaldsonii]|uniref:NAD-dependent epimerase/dehydratase family protein n=1 Tax=Legionella donaldsonii TaxID=45060 RepID=UPI00399D11C1
MISIVTGATGCLGLNLTRRLIQEGHDVIALGRNEHLGKIVSQLGAQFIPMDLAEKEKLKKISANADLIFHCAARSSIWGAYREFYQANVIGTQNIIEATPSHARLIHVSSPSIYFDFTEKHGIKEDAPLPRKPANHYIQTKLLAERLIDEAYQKKNLRVITIRPRAIFGPYDRAIVPRILQSERKGVLPVIGNGQNIIDITYVDNVVESLVLAANASNNVEGKKYNITNDEPKTLIAILSMVFTALHKSLQVNYLPYQHARVIAYCLENFYRLFRLKQEPPLTCYSAGVLALGQTLNIDAAKQDLHYKPLLNIEKGIERFAKWYQDL